MPWARKVNRPNTTGHGEFDRACQAAYRLLTYKPRSRKEMISRLEMKGFSSKVIEEAVKRLEAQKYIDDDSYGQSLARSLIQRKLLGRDALMSELLKRGLDRELVERIIENSYIESDESDLAIRALEKKWRNLSENPIEVAKRRASDYLRRKGFSFGIIRRVIVEKFGI
jgi:regulatory protein